MIVLACIIVPELNRLMPEASAWTWYLTTNELAKAALCLAFVRPPFGLSAAVWYISQAVDEYTGNNVWDGVHDWQEVALFTVLACATWASWFWKQNDKRGVHS